MDYSLPCSLWFVVALSSVLGKSFTLIAAFLCSAAFQKLFCLCAFFLLLEETRLNCFSKLSSCFSTCNRLRSRFSSSCRLSVSRLCGVFFLFGGWRRGGFNLRCSRTREVVFQTRYGGSAGGERGFAHLEVFFFVCSDLRAYRMWEDCCGLFCLFLHWML